MPARHAKRVVFWLLALVASGIFWQTSGSKGLPAGPEGGEDCQASQRGHRKRARHMLNGPSPAADGGGSWQLILSEDTGATGAWSGNKVWPGALALLGYVHETFAQSLSELRVLELGSGLPLLSAALAALGAEVCATDHPDVISQVRDAADGLLQGLPASARARLNFAGYAWGESSASAVVEACNFTGPVGLVLGADLVYDGFPVNALYSSMADLLVQNPCSAMLALQPRQFPMTAALREPGLIAGFLKRFIREGAGQVTTKPVGAEDFGIPEQSPLPDGEPSWKGLTLATITTPTSRNLLAHAEMRQAEKLQYRREVLAPA